MFSMIVACALAQSSLPIATVARGVVSDISEPRQVVVRTQSEWETLWKAHAPDEPARKLSFGTTMVIGVFLGTRPTAGYEVEIVRARAEKDALIVEYVERPPGRDAIVAQVLTAPFHLVSLGARAGSVRFERAGGAKH